MTSHRTNATRAFARTMRGVMTVLLLAVAVLGSVLTSHAAEMIAISRDDNALDLTRAVDIYQDRGAAFQVSTAPDAQGIVNTIEVEATNPEGAGSWAVFVLSNTTSEQIDRLIVAPHYRLVGSGLVWPDLGASRIANITPSEGFSLERIENRNNDVFAITLNPGSVITFVVEMSSTTLPQLYLWEEEAFKDITNSYTLYHGIVLGIAGLLALFLTVIFVVRGTSTFPAAAVLAWSALAYVCIDFGFIDQFFQLEAADRRYWRAVTEASVAASLALFLYTYLRLNRWNQQLRFVVLMWVLGTLALFGLLVYDASMAAGLARISIAVTAVLGLLLIFYTGLKGFDRAIMLVPSWLLLLAFNYAAWLTVSGTIDNDIVQPALAGALVLIILMIGFTVMQNAFSGGAFQQNLFSDTELQALAVKGSDAIVWNWDVPRERITTVPDISLRLGNDRAQLQGAPKLWLKYLHAEDRERFRSTLDAVVEQQRGRMSLDMRLRTTSNHYSWFRLRARPIIGSDGEVIRCVGTLVNVDDQKRAEERMMHDAVHDNLTGLPNRELFLDRVRTTVAMASAESSVLPTVFIVDLDRFKELNESIGISASDTLLISVSRRLRRLLKPHDTIARIAGDQFGIILMSETEPGKIASFAELIKKTIRSPVDFADQKIVLTASIGLATMTPVRSEADDLFGDAELALYQAKRFGGDRVEPFRPAFRTSDTNRMQMEADLRRAMEREELSLVYQPIVDTSTGQVAGFEALMRWHHPRRGEISPGEFIEVAERNGLIIELGRYALTTALRQLMEWDSSVPDTPIFVSVNVSAEQLESGDLAHDVSQLTSRYAQRSHQLRLEITETCVMSNPENAVNMLNRIRDLGVSLAVDDFGTGYSSLSYLSRFPFDVLKIDKSFLAMDKQTRSALLRSIIEMAHALEMSVIAEGVENSEIIDELHALGCEYVQGYAAGHAMSADDATALIQQQNPLIAGRKAAE